ncbi:MAG: TonB-dependent receptor [Acidobacteriota bacterium]
MLRFLVLLANVAVLMLCCINNTSAQTAQISVTGRVSDQTGATISGATVTLRKQSEGVEHNVSTDDEGTFRFDNLISGVYLITATVDGFATATHNLTVVDDGNNNVEITLVPSAFSDQVVITATRTAETIDTITGAVTVISGNQLAEQASLTNNISDSLGKLVPGLAPGSQSMSIFGQTLRGRNVLVLIDGVPQSTTRNISRDLITIDPAAVDRVEVIRGATAIYGDGATGGIINIITKRPNVEAPIRFSTDFRSTMSLTHPEDSLGGTIYQTITGKRKSIDYVIGASFDRTGGFFDADGDRIPPDPQGQGGLADTNTFNILGKFGWDVTPQQRFQFTFNFFDNEQETNFASDPSVNRLPATKAKARAIKGVQLEDRQGGHNTLFNLDYQHQNFFGNRINTQAYYRDYVSVFFPFDGRAFPIFGGTIFQSVLDSEKAGGRINVDTPLGSKSGLRVVWGLDVSVEKTAQPVFLMDTKIFDQSKGLVFKKISERIFVPPINQRNLGLFAQLEYRGIERLVLRGGIRYERIRSRIRDFVTLANNSVRGGELNYDETLFNIGAVVQATNTINIFGNFAQGFSVPDIGLVVRGAPKGASINTLPFQGQKVDLFEVGVRMQWQKLQSSLSTFYNTSDLGTSSGGFNAPVIRAPERVYGFEATIDVQPSSRLQLGTAISVVEGKSDPNLDGKYTFLNSFRIPPIKVTAYLEHNTLPRWQNRFQVLYSGNRNRFRNSVAFGERRVGDYVTLDWISSVRLKRGVLRFSVENLLNNQYFTRESQLLRTGRNDSFAAARGAVLSVGYSINY